MEQLKQYVNVLNKLRIKYSVRVSGENVYLFYDRNGKHYLQGFIL